jgi:hypothetical protein
MDADNLYFTLKSMNCLCRILGVACYSMSDIKNYDDKGGLKFRKLLWPYFLVVVLMCGYIYRTGFMFLVEVHLVEHTMLFTDIMNTTMQYMTCIVLTIFRAVTHQKNMSLIVRKFSLLNERVASYHSESTVQRGVSPIVRVALLININMMLLLSCVNLVVWGTHWSPQLIIGEIWSRCAVYVVTVEYILLVQHYKHKHKQLNYEIAALNNLIGSKIRVFVFKNMRELLSIGNCSNPRVSNHNSFPVLRNTLYLSRVKALTEHHMDLFDAAQLLNSAYGFQILLSFSLIFTDHVLSYNFVIDLVFKVLRRREGIVTDGQELSSLFMALISTLTLIFVTLSCHVASEEAKKSQLLVHKLLLGSELSPDATAQLQLFSSQVSNLKVKFTTCGFFTINASLLYATAGVICTYLIILYQFK